MQRNLPPLFLLPLLLPAAATLMQLLLSPISHLVVRLEIYFQLHSSSVRGQGRWQRRLFPDCDSRETWNQWTLMPCEHTHPSSLPGCDSLSVAFAFDLALK